MTGKSERKQETAVRKGKSSSFWSLRVSLDQDTQRNLMLLLVSVLIVFIVIPKGGSFPVIIGPGTLPRAMSRRRAICWCPMKP